MPVRPPCSVYHQWTRRRPHAGHWAGRRLTPDDLTAEGRLEPFQHGVGFRWRYPHLQADTVPAGYQDRVRARPSHGRRVWVQPPGLDGRGARALHVMKLVERFTDAAGDAKPVYLEFGLDTSVYPPWASQKTTRRSPSPGPSGGSASGSRRRRSRPARRCPGEKFTCGPFSNDAPFPLATCAGVDARYRSGALADFVRAYEAALGWEWGDAACNAS
ncbi:hypothetical protein BD413DRAFT_494117 [Trametes elegans]|nr:hypothetical protein BD413DRAFT_494117 [Trametes elegans]